MGDDAEQAGPEDGRSELGRACARWQSGQSESSRLRGAARALTGVEHYFRADFIAEHERHARQHPETMLAAVTLLRAIESQQPLDADGWNRATGLPVRGFAGRGIKAKPEVEPEILTHIGSGHLDMPLWGLSLDLEVTEKYGGRFRFVIEGPFPGIAAWTHSGDVHHEREIIAGGRYTVLGTHDEGELTVVRLAYAGPSGPPVGSDPLLLDLLSDLEEVQRSALTRQENADTLTVTVPTSRTLTATHSSADPDRVAVSYTVDSGPPASGTVPADPDKLRGWAAMRIAGQPLPGLKDRVGEAISVRGTPKPSSYRLSTPVPTYRPVSIWWENPAFVYVECRNWGDSGVVSGWLREAGFTVRPAPWDYGYDDTTAILVTDPDQAGESPKPSEADRAR